MNDLDVVLEPVDKVLDVLREMLANNPKSAAEVRRLFNLRRRDLAVCLLGNLIPSTYVGLRPAYTVINSSNGRLWRCARLPHERKSCRGLGEHVLVPKGWPVKEYKEYYERT
jgi:hypothetical protein